MKIYLLFACLIFTFSVSLANIGSKQADPVKETLGEPLSSNAGNNDTQFIFRVFDFVNKPKGEIELHFLGDEIAEKWTLVNELYLRKGEISVGFGTSYTETIKPSIFNAVCKMNNYYKKSFGKGSMNKEEVQHQFSWILDCALAAFQSDETKNFELALMKTRNAEQIIQLFMAVKIEKL